MVFIPYRYSDYGQYWFEPDYEVGYYRRPTLYTKSYKSYLDEHLSHNVDLKREYLTYWPLWEATGRSWKSWKYFNDYLRSYSSLKDLKFRNRHYGPLPNPVY